MLSELQPFIDKVWRVREGFSSPQRPETAATRQSSASRDPENHRDLKGGHFNDFKDLHTSTPS
jgi:hypothetical protein